MASQTKRMSALESLTNVVLGFVIALIVWIPIAYFMDIPYTFSSSIVINLIFTAISMARGYLVRRAFARYT